MFSKTYAWIGTIFLLFLIRQVSSQLCVSSEKSLSCHSLEEYATSYNYLIQSDRVLQFLSGSHFLNTTLNVKEQSNVSLIGTNQNAIIECTGENSGFKFESSNKTKLEDLQFIGCGTIFKNRRYRDRASLVFTNGFNLSITNVSIQNATDAGILVINISKTTFISRLNISNTRSTLRQVRGSEIAYYKGNGNYKLILQDSVFVNNNHNGMRNNTQVSGLTIRVSNCYASITITRSIFRNNRGMSKGGNLAINMVRITDITKLNVTLANLLIAGGYSNSGGGLYIFITKSMRHSISSEMNSNTIHSYTVIENITFIENKAKFLGAALYTQVKASPLQLKICHVISIKNCSFSKNFLSKKNKGGIAMHNNHFDIDSYLTEFNPQYKIILNNCSFQQHYISNSTGSSGGNSVLFINSHDYIEIGNVTITKNKVNAITAVSSNILLKGNITLSRNIGSSGGGLLLCQGATIYLTPYTMVNISYNKVSKSGGGICVEPRCLIQQPRCFFQVDNETKYNPELLSTIKIHLHDNKAEYGGDNLYGGDVDYCYMIDSPEKNRAPNTSLEVFHTVFNVSNKTVTSPPRQICFCDHDSEVVNCEKNKARVSSYPGKRFNIKAVLVGQLYGIVPGVVRTWNQENITFQHDAQNMRHNCTPLEYTINADPSVISTVHFKIGVEHTGDQSGYERLNHYKMKILTVDIKPCPIGFQLDSDTTCNECILKFDGLECRLTNGLFIKRKQNADAWLSFQHGNLTTDMPTAIKYHSNCPFDYCTKRRRKLHLKKSSADTYKICANNRAGIMCGACKDGYSTMLGSSKCGKCSNKHLFLLVCFAFAGLGLVAALTLLNLTISEGTLSGLIFYANVIEYNSSFIIPDSDRYTFPTPMLRVFIAWINLDFGITTCLFDGMDEYAEAWLEFAFPLYIWSIAVVIILLSNKFQIVARLASRNAVKVLATLVLLSYATFTHAVISTFSFSSVHTLAEDNTTVTETTWLIDGNIKYFEVKHALLFAFALFFGLITTPFTFVLLFINPLQKFSHKKLFRWVESLKPFIDAFTGPYTKNGRFWPGLLLLARICLSISGGLNTLSANRVIQGATSLVIIILLGTATLVRTGLYRFQVLNVLEYFFLLNLSILFLGSTYYSGYGSMQKIVFDSTVSLAFVTFTVIVLYHLLLKVRKYSISTIIIFWLNAKRESFVRLIWKPENRAHTMSNYPPYNTFNEEREPLLADHEE